MKRNEVVRIASVGDLPELSEKVMHAVYDGRSFNRWLNPDGSVGGFVEKGARIDKLVEVDPKAIIFSTARIHGYVKIHADARVYGVIGRDDFEDSAKLLQGNGFLDHIKGISRKPVAIGEYW